MTATPAVEFENVSFAYDGVSVLEDVNLRIPARELACVLGPNGGGKTTLLRLILGLAEPDRGTVRVLGRAPARARRRVGYMPQYARFDPKFPIAVMDVVLMGRLERHLGGPYSRADREVARLALAHVALAELADRPFDRLSGGQRQRVLIARALACEPELLLLDEPTAGLDVAVEERFFDVLARLNETMTILLVSHEVGFVSEHMESVICVNRRVNVHPTSDITGEVIRELYGSDVRLVRHDHRCAEEGHSHG